MCCAMWRIITLWMFSAAFILPSGHQASVFYSSQEANQVLKIQKRANSFLEELKPGSYQRECVEEQCDFEEASEIFETREATLKFWTKYVDGDQCESNPCFNGTCMDNIGRYDCICNKGWEGLLCEYEIRYTNCSIDNGGCDHLCNENQDGDQHQRYCKCASGYRLMDNHTSCAPVVEFPCGRVVEFKQGIGAKVIGGKSGRKGDSPWQVMLYDGKGAFKCGGVLIHPTWVLTAAHCVVREERVKLKFGKYNRREREDSEQMIYVDNIVHHENYTRKTSDNDIAMLHLAHPVVFNRFVLPICLPSKNLAERVLMKEGTKTVVTGWGSQSEEARNYSHVLNYIEIPVVSRNECAHAMWNSISDNMLCAGIMGDNRDSCHGDSGGPMVAKFKDTQFLVGLVSWGEGCGGLDTYGVYTKVSAYLDWIYLQMKVQDVSKKNTKSQKVV